MKRYLETVVAKESVTELDLVFPFYDEDQNINEVEIPYSEIKFAEAPSIDINYVINTLLNMKEKGANRVYIADHIDHHGYYFYGVKLEELSENTKSPEDIYKEKLIKKYENELLNTKDVFLNAVLKESLVKLNNDNINTKRVEEWVEDFKKHWYNFRKLK
jgi:hypothetical protein